MVSRVAVLSDVHGMPALERVLAEPAVRSAELVVVTGDHTWGPQPAQVLDRLVDLGEHALLIRGNDDRELLAMSRGIDVGLDDEEVVLVDSRAERWAASAMPEVHAWLEEAVRRPVEPASTGASRTGGRHRQDQPSTGGHPQRW